MEQAGEKRKRRGYYCKAEHVIVLPEDASCLSRLELAKPINIQFSPQFVMKAAADCARGAANLSIYGDGKISLECLGDAEGGTDEIFFFF